MKNYLKLISLVKQYKRLFGIALSAMIVTSIFRVFELSMMVPLIDRIFNNKKIIVPTKLPSFLMRLVDYLNGLEPQTLLNVLPIVVLIGMLIKHAATYGYGYLMNDIAQRTMRDVRQQLYEKIQTFSLDYFSKKRTGELMSRITSDVLIIENSVSYGLTDLFVQIFSVFGFMAMAFTIHFKAAVILFCSFFLLVYPVARIGKKLRKLTKATQERVADINSILLETISGVRIVKAFCTEDYECRRFKGKNQEFYKLKIKAIRRILLQDPMTEIFGVLCGIAIIIWMGRQVMHHQLSFGIFILFFASIMSMISPLKKLGNVNVMVQQALAANERIHDILDTVPTVQEKPDARDLPRIQKEIALSDVWFGYDRESGEVLKGINLTIRMGELVALVGPTGTGKTTLANLIPRFYDVTKGSVKIDGVDVRDITMRSLRNQIGIVTQETFLFNDTVEANIAYGVTQPFKNEVEGAAQKAYAHSFIMNLPEKYQTIIGERGFRLSGGEKQRLAIARAIFKNPPILILDEATSQLDSESEKYVQEALDKLMQGRTTIAIAHRLSTIKKANKIVVLEKGQVVGIGRHEELLGNCPLYRRLHDTQFQM